MNNGGKQLIKARIFNAPQRGQEQEATGRRVHHYQGVVKWIGSSLADAWNTCPQPSDSYGETSSRNPLYGGTAMCRGVAARPMMISRLPMLTCLGYVLQSHSFPFAHGFELRLEATGAYCWLPHRKHNPGIALSALAFRLWYLVPGSNLSPFRFRTLVSIDASRPSSRLAKE